MKIFKGWYRQSLTKGRWHRAWHVSSVLSVIQDTTTLCNKKIPSIDCDFDFNPDNKCITCEKKENNNDETHRCFAPVGKSSEMTRPLAILELRRLLKSRVYQLRILANIGIKITAQWVQGTIIDIEIVDINLSVGRLKNVYTLDQIQSDLCRFSMSIDWLCLMCDKLALENKRKKKLKGRTTSSEKTEYFEELLAEAEKKR